jgi:spermidine synthase
VRGLSDWHLEKQSEDVDLRIRKEKIIYSGKSEFQNIEVFESKTFGRVMVIDGYLMLTEKDEFIYHEMMVHVPMSMIADPKNVLVIGGGDGGTVRELARHACIEKIDFVEIDGDVIETSKKYFPSVSCSIDDPRVDTLIENGIEFVAETNEKYDLIIVDSTDPHVGPGEGLFTSEFYGNCHKILNDGGILVNQHESPYYEKDAKVAERMHKTMREIFSICTVYQAFIPTYPSGHWLFGFASKTVNPESPAVKGRMDGIETKYFNEEVRKASFALPNYVKKLLE